MYVYVYVFVYVCMCVCICMYVMYCNEISCNLMYLSVLKRFFPINQVSHQSSIRWVKSTRSPALLKTHLQHPVRFIQDHKGRASQVAALHLHDVNEASGGGNDDLTATCPDHELFMIECG